MERYRYFVDAGVSDVLPSTSEVELSSTMIEFGNILDRAEQTPQIFGAGNWISCVNCYRFRTAGHKTIPSAHRIEPTLHWHPWGQAAYCRSMSFPHDGSGSELSRLRNFGRDGFRIITLDERAGRSIPAPSIGGNATQSLRDGIARIREQLSIRHWPTAIASRGKLRFL